MTRCSIVIAFLLLGIAVVVQGLQPTMPLNQNAELTAYLKAHWLSPEEYVVSKFQDHDIVFLGEWHRIKHDPEFIQALIPPLYKAGIYDLGIEFANYSDLPLIDKLINGKRYDEDLARRIAFSQFVFWGYQEYEDIYRAAWTVNRSLPKGAPRFRVVGLNYCPNWKLLTVPKERLTPIFARTDWLVFDTAGPQGRECKALLSNNLLSIGPSWTYQHVIRCGGIMASHGAFTTAGSSERPPCPR